MDKQNFRACVKVKQPEEEGSGVFTIFDKFSRAGNISIWGGLSKTKEQNIESFEPQGLLPCRYLQKSNLDTNVENQRSNSIRSFSALAATWPLYF